MQNGHGPRDVMSTGHRGIQRLTAPAHAAQLLAPARGCSAAPPRREYAQREPLTAVSVGQASRHDLRLMSRVPNRVSNPADSLGGEEPSSTTCQKIANPSKSGSYVRLRTLTAS